ncbi:hypothetical protein C8A05DRAFT_38591 [Staphylotrichum tortipilum]|uniref:Uncharacterized protein n=1 Tax=Staphylotrichum tortipilum TaxID=2831512 RepID=A0AAN6MBF4_9PEZI|nr:hypothetical protein C8A05DRAFT_38591 [Staphylotrichum longicolle]
MAEENFPTSAARGAAASNAAFSAPPTPWGSLPVEQYLLRNWDPSSPLSATAQREQLVRAFIQSDPPETEPAPVTPSPEQIRNILEPWRPQKLRRIAHEHANSGPSCQFYFLRTYYGDPPKYHDAALAEFLDELEDCMSADLSPEDWWYVVLDDAEFFSVGEEEDWERKVYDVFPELAAPRAKKLLTDTNVYYIRDMLEWLTPDGTVEEEDLAEAVRSVIRHDGHRLVLMDREAFQTGRFGLVFRDAKGNVVRRVRATVEDLGDVNISDFRGALTEQWFWLDAEVGSKYRVGGEIVSPMVDAIKETYL